MSLSKLAPWLAVLLQLAYLAALAADRELLLRTGDTVVVRTAPVDPRDLFRGDYVTLTYEMSSVSSDAVRGGEVAAGQAGQPVYALLEPMPGSSGVSRLAHLSTERPTTGRFLAGRTVRDWRLARSGSAVGAHYGLETYFVEQGHGLEIEERRGQRDGVQTALEMILAVDSRGRAVIRGHRWSPLGTRLELVDFRRPAAQPRGSAAPPEDEEPGAEEPRAEEPAPTLRFEIHNLSDETRWLIDPGDHCAFRIFAGAWGGPALDEARPGCPTGAVGAEALRPLAPGEVYTVTADPSAARWWIAGEDGPMSLLEAEPNRRFRLLYRPDPAWADGLGDSPEPWLADLASPAFTAVGVVD